MKRKERKKEKRKTGKEILSQEIWFDITEHLICDLWFETLVVHKSSLAWF